MNKMKEKTKEWFIKELKEGEEIIRMNKEQLLWIIWHERALKTNFAIMMLLSMIVGILIAISITIRVI